MYFLFAPLYRRIRVFTLVRRVSVRTFPPPPVRQFKLGNPQTWKHAKTTEYLKNFVSIRFNRLNQSELLSSIGLIFSFSISDHISNIVNLAIFCENSGEIWHVSMFGPFRFPQLLMSHFQNILNLQNPEGGTLALARFHVWTISFSTVVDASKVGLFIELFNQNLSIRSHFKHHEFGILEKFDMFPCLDHFVFHSC